MEENKKKSDKIANFVGNKKIVFQLKSGSPNWKISNENQFMQYRCECGECDFFEFSRNNEI